MRREEKRSNLAKRTNISIEIKLTNYTRIHQHNGFEKLDKNEQNGVITFEITSIQNILALLLIEN